MNIFLQRKVWRGLGYGPGDPEKNLISNPELGPDLKFSPKTGPDPEFRLIIPGLGRAETRGPARKNSKNQALCRALGVTLDFHI